MNNHYLEKHLEFIKENIASGLIVYKGFSIEFVKQVSKTIPFVTTPDYLDNNRVSLDKLLSNKKNIIKGFLSVEKLKITTYEEFTIACRNINPEMFDFNVTVVNNELFRGWYPNTSNFDFPDQLKEIEKNDRFEPDDIFQHFYSNSKIIGKYGFVSYFDLNSEDFISYKEIDFFENFIAEKSIVLSPDTGDNDLIELPSPDDIFTQIKTEFYLNKPHSKYSFLISEKGHHFEENLIRKELLIISEISKYLNIEINIYSKKETIEEDVRDQFQQILEKYWGSDSFRNLLFYKEPDYSNNKIDVSQGQVIEYLVKQAESAISDQKYRDVFITAPTGAGKSLLFQIPAIYLSENDNLVTVVVSPLKALMYDQVISLREKGVSTACYINSDISYIKRQETIEALHNGEKSILYLSPELLLSYSISEFIGNRQIGLLVIDEAHLVSTWGRDFRVDYWYLGKYIRNIRKYSQQHFPIVALTATAVYGGDNDIVFQTVESLNMRLPKLYIGNVRRSEIHFDIKKFKYDGSHEEEKIKHTVKKLEDHISSDIKTICYFPWTRQIEATMLNINSDLKDYVGKYYGSVDQYERQDVIDKFKNNEIKCVLATKAFGMGVDISDILAIYHHAPSGNLSDYVQEIGRVAREKSLKGSAVVDFSEKDLKFTKILYGLSSVKLYQIKLVLQKIYNIYSLKKKQNMLFSVEDFQYIFPNASDIDAKVKSTLLLIENDLLDKYGYYVVLVRPKSLYSTVFAEIPKNIEKKFISKYKKYCKIISKPALNGDIKIKTYDGLTITQNGSENNFYIIELDKLWEKHFSDDSFPRVKKKFFEKELFSEFEDENPLPLNKLSVSLNQSIPESYELLTDYWEMLCDAFQDLSGRFFTAIDFENLLKYSIKDSILRKRICDLVLTTYSSRIRLQGSNLRSQNSESFLQMRTENNIPKYRVMNNRFFTVSKKIKRQFSHMFCLNEPYFEKYLSPKSSLTTSYIKLVHQLESFRIGSYEFSGGMLPRIFVRINDPFKVRLISNDQSYKNEILQDINSRQVSSMNIMEYFFTKEIDDATRWNFIEDFFLGKGESDLIDSDKVKAQPPINLT